MLELLIGLVIGACAVKIMNTRVREEEKVDAIERFVKIETDFHNRRSRLITDFAKREVGYLKDILEMQSQLKQYENTDVTKAIAYKETLAHLRMIVKKDSIELDLIEEVLDY